MELQDIMTTQVAVVGPDNTVLDACKLMQIHNVGALPVCQHDGKVVGIVTDRDIVVRNIANGGDPKTTPVRTVMTKDVICANPSMEVEEAAELMAQHKIRRLPVVQNDRLVGMVSIGDLATRYRFVEEAGEALSEISEPSRPVNIMQ
ncbi:CBS domain-containing protein [Caldicoprobacter faecalis]|uniref:CBS domain-containing protein n=1 Tax=Caldicoprobacter faecalis TaxID=937334 RepID=A0A1I5TT20_9FIRM|nr:CBS domain-containing protein [Caldicoprobacter faecalis]PZN12017.1 MAG: CBS domain-containing protein [Caldicoprobacter oshimai]SFP86202.1 CBS domain-containing protein [Caldicoprobacter faecalis]